MLFRSDFLSTINNLRELDVKFNCLELSTFEKILYMIKKNINLKKLKISFFPEEDTYFSIYQLLKIEEDNILRIASKKVNSEDDNSYKRSEEKGIKEDEDGFIISDIYEESPDGIIDKLFTQPQQKQDKDDSANNVSNEKNIHKIDPDDYALYKKYL